MREIDVITAQAIEKLELNATLADAANIIGDLGLVLDWVRVAKSIVAVQPRIVIAGILEDWTATAGIIYKDGQALTPDLLEEYGISRAHTSSQVGTPGIAMIYPGEPHIWLPYSLRLDEEARAFACAKRAQSKDDWGIFWDSESLAILGQA